MTAMGHHTVRQLYAKNLVFLESMRATYVNSHPEVYLFRVQNVLPNCWLNPRKILVRKFIFTKDVVDLQRVTFITYQVLFKFLILISSNFQVSPNFANTY